MSGDYLDREAAIAKLRIGRELSDDELAGHFAMKGPDERTEILLQIQRDSSGEISSDTTDMRREARKMRTIQALHQTHETLRRLGK
jgi:hypothetical protein